MTDAQRSVYREICAGPRGRMGLPTNVLLRCPELARRSAKLGEYVRFETSLPKRIMEFAVLIAARSWTTEYEWQLHCPQALKAGLRPQVVIELGQGKRPSGMKDDEAAAYEFCTALHRDKEINDTTFDAALKQFGESGVVELIGVSGYFTLVSMALKANSRKPLPAGAPLPLPPLG